MKGGSPGISRSDVDYSLMELNFTTELKHHPQQSSKKKMNSSQSKKKIIDGGRKHSTISRNVNGSHSPVKRQRFFRPDVLCIRGIFNA